jgi:phage-related protein
VGKSLEHISTEEIFLNRTQISYALRSRIDKWDLIKLQSFCKAKDTVNKTKWQPIDWEKIFTNSTSDRGLIANIYKELKKLDSSFNKYDLTVTRVLSQMLKWTVDDHLRKLGYKAATLTDPLQLYSVDRSTYVDAASSWEHWCVALT